MLSHNCRRPVFIILVLSSVVFSDTTWANPTPQQWEPELDLAWAVCECDESRVEDLIASGADIDGTDSQGMTALMWAAGVNSLDMTRLLVDAGANVFLEDDSGRRALELSISLGHGISHPCKCERAGLEVIEYLAQLVPRESLRLGYAANRDGRWEAVPLLLRMGAHPQPGGVSLISRAVDENVSQIPRLRELLEAFHAAGADFDLQGPVYGSPLRFGHEQAGVSPLVIAVNHRSLETVQMLLELGADPGSSDTPVAGDAIEYAYSLGALSLANALIEAGGTSARLPVGRWFGNKDSSMRVRLEPGGVVQIEFTDSGNWQSYYSFVTKDSRHLIQIDTGGNVSTFEYQWIDVHAVQYWADSTRSGGKVPEILRSGNAGRR